MLASPSLSLDALLLALRAAGEPTRLRVLALLADGELSVKDLTEILEQSQPRISRHLKLLSEAGLVSRYREGAFVHYRLGDGPGAAALARSLLSSADAADPKIVADRERLRALRREQAESAARYFAESAADWDAIRSLHIPEQSVEAAMLEAAGDRQVEALLDLGTGTGRVLELFAPLYRRGIGVDASPAMLQVARANLDRARLAHAQVRQGDFYRLPFPAHSFDLVTIHQVLHYLEDPGAAIAEAARMLRRGGRLLVVDFAPHELEFLRERHAHRRLGFDHATVSRWLAAAGLEPLRPRDLPPDGEGDKLTVTLWLARDPHFVVAGDQPALAGSA